MAFRQEGSEVKSMQLTRQQLRLCIHATGALITVSMIAAAYSFALRPADVEIAEAYESLEASRKIVQNRDAIIADAETAACERYATEQRLKELLALIPNRPEESRFLSQLSELAASCELDIQRFLPSAPEADQRVNRIRVQLDGAGTYDSLCRFLDGLHSLQRLTQVTELAIDNSSQTADYNVHLELSIFFADDSKTKVAQKPGALK